MTRHAGRLIAALLLLLLPAGGAAAQQTLGLSEGTAGQKAMPVRISADNGIEWRQAEHVYIARGNVKAVRGDVTVYADEMRAYYRPTAKAAAAKTAPTDTGKPRKPGKQPGVNLDEGPTEVYRLEAIGHVRFVTPTQRAFGDHADYDVDTARLVMTGEHLRAVSQRDVLTARDSLEWYDKKQLGVARGHAVDYHDGKTIAADILMATMAHAKGEASHISRMDAHGHVVVVSKDEIARGDEGVYNAATGIVTLSGHVQLTRGRNEMRGAYGVVDLNRNVGKLLPAPPGERVAGAPLRVEGLIVPNPPQGAPAGAAGTRSPPAPPPPKPAPPAATESTAGSRP